MKPIQNQVKIISLTKDEFNSKLDNCEGRYRKYEKPTKIISHLKYIWQDNKKNLHLMYKDSFTNKTVHYKMDPYTGEKDDKVEVHKPGARAIRYLNKFCKKYNEDYIFKDNKYYDDNHTWEQLEDCNPKYANGKWIKHCYQYDMNSCYPNFMQKPLPYGDIIRKNDIVGEGEIGFVEVWNKNHKKALEAVFKGDKAELIFKTKIYQGFKDYATFMYNWKIKAKEKAKETGDTTELDTIKTIYNALNGNLKHYNIFIAVAVIGYAKQYMIKNMPNNCIMITVDSYTTIGPSDKPLPMGDGLGDFKPEYIDAEFRYYSNAKKGWNTDNLKDGLKYKGLKKSRINDDLTLKDVIYYYDKENDEIKEKNDEN